MITAEEAKKSVKSEQQLDQESLKMLLEEANKRVLTTSSYGKYSCAIHKRDSFPRASDHALALLASTLEGLGYVVVRQEEELLLSWY